MLFSCLFQCFEEKEYQTESKRNETFGRVIFGTEAIQETWSRRRGSFEVATRQGGTPPPPWAPRGSLTDFFRLYISIYPKNIEDENRSGVPPPEASVATENQSRPVSAPCRSGGIPLRWPSSSSQRSPLLGNVVISKKFLCTHKIMVMHSNERGECCPRTLVDRLQKR